MYHFEVSPIKYKPGIGVGVHPNNFLTEEKYKMNGKKILVLVIFIVLSLVFASCSLLDRDGAEKYKTIKSSTSNLTFEVPASWTETKSSPITSAEATDTSNGNGFFVIEEPADHFVDGFTLDDYSLLVLGEVMKNVGTDAAPTINDVVICNDIKAKQFEISGSVEGVKAISYFVIAKVNGIFYQIHGSSYAKNYDDAKPTYITIIDSIDFGAEAIVDEPEAEPAKSEEKEDTVPAVQVIKSKESSLTLEFPADWTEGFDTDGVTIEMDNFANDYYALVIEENAIDFRDSFTLDDYTDVIAKIMVENLGAAETPEITNINIGDGVQAKQFTVRGEDGNFKLTYLITCIKENEIFYNIQLYSVSSKFEKVKPVFDEIIKSAKF